MSQFTKKMLFLGSFIENATRGCIEKKDFVYRMREIAGFRTRKL